MECQWIGLENLHPENIEIVPWNSWGFPFQLSFKAIHRKWFILPWDTLGQCISTMVNGMLSELIMYQLLPACYWVVFWWKLHTVQEFFANLRRVSTTSLLLLRPRPYVKRQRSLLRPDLRLFHGRSAQIQKYLVGIIQKQIVNSPFHNIRIKMTFILNTVYRLYRFLVLECL